MGVHGLWELLSPIGHRVSNDNVRNKILAVDVSIWLTQFVKAMRDAEGAQVRNAHLLGVFRRCVKLLYLSVKPVLVFDGATPALKRRTLSARRAQREKHEAKLRRLAEKMLLNRIKRKTIDRAIAKKRKGIVRNRSMATQESPSLRNVPEDAFHDLKEGEPISPEREVRGRGNMQSDQPSERPPVAEEKSPGLSGQMVSLDVPYDGSDSDDMNISVPQNVDDLDDEVLMKLPTKVQAEVFKQVKLEQRAQHRENMMLKRQDPSEFSKMQIEGFLRHTALNRKISRVRNVMNAKSGASQRIASDSGRNFILEEEGLMEPHREKEGSRSHSERLMSSSLEQQASDDTTDLLAFIRTRKETGRLGAAVSSTQPPSTLLREPRHRESGTDWASKVLEGNGGLVLRTRIPGDRVIASDGHFSADSDDDSDIRLKEQQRSAAKAGDSTQGTHAILRKETTTIDDSEDDEWEDGDQPVRHDFSSVFGEDRAPSEVKISKANHVSKGNGHPNLFGPLSQEPVSTERGPDYHETNHEASPTNESSRTKEYQGNQTAPSCRSHEEKADCEQPEGPISQSTIVPGISRPQYSEENKSEEDEEGKLKSVLEPAHGIGNAGEPGRSSYNHSVDDYEHPQLPIDGIQRRRQVQEGDLPVKSGGEKAVSFTCSENLIGCKPGSNLENTSQRGKRKECIELLPAIPKGKKHVSDCEMPPSSLLLGLDDSQAERGRNTEAPDFSVHKMLSNSCGEPRRLSVSPNCDSSPDFREVEIISIEDGEESRNKANSYRSNTDSPERTPCRSAGFKSPENDQEMSHDIEFEQPTRKHSSPDYHEAPEHSFAQLESMQEELEVESREIDRQRTLHQGGADSVADEMYEETRDLIKLFGIPYLEAPMEAEAQCAFLNKEKIVDGVLTEDSDAFLFGALTVYRQLFAEGRFAEAYEAYDIKLSLGLDRDNLIRLAYLLGSDYTAGVRGVGIVNSMEILEAFPGPSGMEEFREWAKSVTVLDEEPEEDIMSGKTQEAVRRRFCWKHRNMKRNWEVREGFPNPAVFEAYINPVVNSSRKRFSWGPVDFEGLAKFCWDKFGWENDRFDSAIGPLRQQLKEKSETTQRRIDEFFKPHRFAKIKSERLQKAVHGMAGDGSKELMTTNHHGHRTRKVNPVTYSTGVSNHHDREELRDDLDSSAVGTNRTEQ